MSHESHVKKMPEAVGYIPRIIKALREMDGIAKAAAVKESIVAAMSEAGELIDETPLKNGAPKYQNDMQWARMYLVNAGLLEPVSLAGHGIWKLTDEGWTTPLDAATVAKIYKGQAAHSDEQTAPNDEGLQQDIPGLNTWEIQLKKILKSMPDKGFERLCAEIMTKNGLYATKVTGQSGDKGIDGEGLLAFDDLELVAIRVAWQCKRFNEGTVGSQAVRDFRGSLDLSTNHGIIFTTSTFTANAIQEASQPAKKPIKLVPLDELVGMLRKLGLGVTTSVPHALEVQFFDKYLHPVGESATASLLPTGGSTVPG
jgi:restriction system protein